LTDCLRLRCFSTRFPLRDFQRRGELLLARSKFLRAALPHPRLIMDYGQIQVVRSSRKSPPRRSTGQRVATTFANDFKSNAIPFGLGNEKRAVSIYTAGVPEKSGYRQLVEVSYNSVLRALQNDKPPALGLFPVCRPSGPDHGTPAAQSSTQVPAAQAHQFPHRRYTNAAAKSGARPEQAKVGVFSALMFCRHRNESLWAKGANLTWVAHKRCKKDISKPPAREYGVGHEPTGFGRK
jgi:hypothetical protein